VVDESRGIGTRIAEVRRLKGLSQVQLAEELGISKPGLANYERGFRVPPASLVADLCEKHGVSAGWSPDLLPHQSPTCLSPLSFLMIVCEHQSGLI